MTTYAQDPGDLTPDEMYGRQPTQADGELAPCRGCHAEDGTLDTEIMDEEGSCVFGCGRVVDRDTKYCGHCGDHAANEWECPRCGAQYADWSGQWEEQRATRKAAA